MKRSEMVKKIADHLAQFMSANVPARTIHLLADAALYEAEREGMLPPMQQIPEYTFTAPHEWEPEVEVVGEK